MGLRIVVVATVLALAGCGREAESSRVVTPTEGRGPGDRPPAGREVRKIEMH